MAGFSLASFGQTIRGVTFTDDSIVIDVLEACTRQGKAASCDLNPLGVNFVLNGLSSSAYYDDGTHSQSRVRSNIPIKSVSYSCRYSGECGTWDANSSTVVGAANGKEVSFSDEIFEVTFKSSYASFPTKVVLNTGVPVYLKDAYASSSRMLRSSYSGVLRNVTGFKNEIAKSHRGHLDRLTETLQAGISLLDTKAKDGKAAYTVLDWRVQENARLIVVFGTVLNELLSDYDDVQRLQTSIKSMRVLVDQLRLSYGWDRGLAGTVSKASSSLIEVVRLELQELASIKMAMGAGDFQIYMDLLKVTRTLQAKVDASKSGDMKAQREIFSLVDLWNGQTWQAEMAKLMNAGPDFKNLVLPKLSMLIFAVESISDLSDQEFIIPDRKLLK